MTYVSGLGNPTDEDILYYNGTAIYNNKINNPLTPIDLGIIAAGTVMDFYLENKTTGYTYTMGNGSLNPDNDVHAYVADGYPAAGSAYVGFEDRIASYPSDFNYQDMNFTFSAAAPAPAPVPEPSTFALLGLGGVAGLIARRRKQKA